MGFGKGLLLTILSFLIIIFLIISSIGAISYTLLYPKTYSTALEEAKVYEKIEESFDKVEGGFFIKIPPEGSKALFEDLLNRLFSYIRSDSDTLNLKVQVDKEKLRGFFIDSIEKLSFCSPNQNPFSENANCRPSDKTSDEFLNEILKQRNVTVLEGDYVDLGTVYGLEDGSDGLNKLKELRGVVSTYKIVLLGIAIALVLLIFFLYLLERNSKKHF